MFWDNFLSGVGDLLCLFSWCLLPYTPALVFVALLISTAWALSFLPVTEVVVVSSGPQRTWPARRAIPWVMGAAALFMCATMMDVSFAGLTDASRQLGGAGAVIVGAAGLAAGSLGLAAHRALRGRKGEGLGFPATRVAASAALLLAFAALARFNPFLFGDGAAFAPLFRELIGKTGGTTAWRLVVLGAAGLAVALVLAPPAPFRTRRRFKRLLLFVVAGVVALATVFRLFPGYIVSGYLMRYCPLTVYLHLVPLAATFYALARTSLNALKSIVEARNTPLTTHSPERRVGSEPTSMFGLQVLAVSALLMLCMLSFYWVTLQAGWIARLDPRATLLKELQKPQYLGASFAVNTYAAPVAYLAQGWAYFDPQLGKSELRNPEGKFYLRRDFRYLWLADKHSNSRYFEPDYFVCWNVRQLLDAVGGGPRCRELQLVIEARRGRSILEHREVARDESGRDAWSIVKLNWTYPPGSGKKIEWHYRQYRRTLALPE